MQTIKLHEATKQFGISNKLAMFFLEKKNVPVKSHSSVISMEQLVMLREFSEHQERFPEILNEFDYLEEEEKKKKAQKAKPEKKEIVEEQKEEIPGIVESVEQVEQVEIVERVERPEVVERVERVQKTEKPGPVEQMEVKKAHPQVKPQAKVSLEDKVKEKKREPERERERERERIRELEKRSKLKIYEEDFEAELDHYGLVKEIPAAVKSVAPPRMPKAKHAPPGAVEFERDKKGKKFEVQKTKEAPHPSRPQKPYKAVRPPRPEPPKPKVKVFNLPELIQISDYISIKELAEKLNLKLKDIEERMRVLKKEYISNQILDVEDARDICKEFHVEVDIIPFEDAVFKNDVEKNKAQLTTRVPVVTVMGHVDHGKTTLLDTLRNTRVAEREAGGITQKIGAYKLPYHNSAIIFLDTPGHEAFSNIRARGAQVTDIVILVVAANDGVMPQTIEAISHARAANVPILVAINKIDMPGANPTKVKQELSKHNVVVEDWGGDVVAVEISAKHNQNLDALLEMVLLVSEMLELKAYKDIPGRGAIIEARLDPQLGPMGTVLIQHGKIKRGDYFICGNSVGKIKAIFDDKGKTLDDAEVPIPVEIMGFENVPEAGERFQVVDDLEKARKVIDMRIHKGKEARKDEANAEKKLSLQNLFERLDENKTQIFPIIMKTDNFSSSEVLETILQKQSSDKLKINIIYKGIGNITESDILLASTSRSILIGFNVKAPQKILGLAKREHVEIKLYNVIYHLIEDIEKAVKGEMKPEFIENHIGTVEVLQIFKITKVGTIAGCLVKEGKVTSKSKLKVLRKDDLVFEGELETLKRVKNDASEVNAGTECGIRIKNFNAIEVGDILEVYELKLKT